MSNIQDQNQSPGENPGKNKGTLFGVGIGPGDPELLTIKAYRVLQESAVIAYPEAKQGTGGYAISIIEDLYDEDKKTMLPLHFPMIKDKSKLEENWENAAKQVLDQLNNGDDVSFITEGDPLFYSTFIHLMKVINDRDRDIEVVVVPGISSAHGAASSLALPLCDGDELFTVVPATKDMAQMETYLTQFDTVVFLKVAKVLQPMLALLKKLNMDDGAYVVEKATSSKERIFRDVKELEGQDIGYLSLMIVRTKENG